jgi:cyclohexanone monooxygenase
MRLPGGMAVQRLLSHAYVELMLPLSAQYSTTLRFTKQAEAAGKAYLRRQVADSVVREKLTPRYVVGCSGPASTTRICPPSTGTTSIWSPTPSRR